jgi:hypothetical protein
MIHVGASLSFNAPSAAAAVSSPMKTALENRCQKTVVGKWVSDESL